MTGRAWVISKDSTDPIVATAIHAGHDLSPNIRPFVALDDATRLLEEDPFTDRWLAAAGNQIRVVRSRFEVDLNRPRDKAVYLNADAAWGLDLWTAPLPAEVIEASVASYDAFYRDLGSLCDEIASVHPRFVVLDLHSYNHRRGGPDAAVDDPEENPEINVGTGSIDPSAWSDVVNAFLHTMETAPFDGGHLDVRENVRFRGGHMSRWINDRYPGHGCAIAVEVKKFYMDEWTGQSDESVVANVGDTLRAASAALRDVLGS